MFQLRQEQLAAIRRKKIGDGLIATFAETPVRAWWSEQKKYVIASDPLDHQTRFGFDDQGFIAAVASPLGRLWQIANYADGRAAILRNPAGHELSLTYTPAGQLSTIASNGSPRLQLHYNDSGQTVAASFPDGTFSAVELHRMGNAHDHDQSPRPTRCLRIRRKPSPHRAHGWQRQQNGFPLQHLEPSRQYRLPQRNRRVLLL